MKPSPLLLITIVSALAGPGLAQKPGKGHGPLPEEHRDVIHALFAEHEEIDRSVEKTADGYHARTISKNPAVAAMLKKHVAQMEERLQSGLGVRQWDPAFAEFREYYDELTLTVETLDDGVSVSVTGKTPEAIRVAHNHADIVSGFVEKGTPQMHAEHPRALPANPDPTEAEQKRVNEIGEAASTALIQSLGAQLKAALQSGGPAGALGVCHHLALPLTAAAGEANEGVSIRRTSLKIRNPENAPDTIDRDILETMESKAKTKTLTPEPVVAWEDKVAHFYRPLMIQETCLACHGDASTFSAELKEALASLYPEDKATGYKTGDLRGVIRVDVIRKQP